MLMYRMSPVKLELRCPKDVDGIKADPEPNWSFDGILSELNSLERKLYASSVSPVPFTKAKSRDFRNGRSLRKSSRGFVMHVSDSETEDEREECQDLCILPAKRFTCNDVYLSDSDDSDDESVLGTEIDFMYKEGPVEGALFELNHEYQLGVTEEIRNRISALETELMSESEKSTSALAKVEKYKEARRDFEKKHDTQYQRKIAEALDSHLTAIQRDHELKSQIEERKIRSDAAYEEAKRREKALQEEKARQEKAKAEAEAKLKAEEAKRAALEEQRKAEKEAAERQAIESSKNISAALVKEGSTEGSLGSKPIGPGSDGSKKSEAKGDIVRASKSALTVEQERSGKLNELDEKNLILRSTSNMDLGRFERPLGRFIKQIRGVKDNVSTKAREIVSILKDPNCPEAISLGAFAKKVVSFCESPDVPAFACGYVIVLVTSQVPHALDILLAEFHRACIYTVPKHIIYSESAFASKTDYYKTLGFREDNGELESRGRYLQRLESYMKLYGALIQTEIQGLPNRHGLEEGWAWLAKFLNSLPANMFTAAALKAFLEVAGFALHRKYKSQFKKMMNVIQDQFLSVLKARGSSELSPTIIEIQSYLEDKKYLEEPEGRTLQGKLLSDQFR